MKKNIAVSLLFLCFVLKVFGGGANEGYPSTISDFMYQQGQNEGGSGTNQPQTPGGGGPSQEAIEAEKEAARAEKDCAILEEAVKDYEKKLDEACDKLTELKKLEISNKDKRKEKREEIKKVRQEINEKSAKLAEKKRALADAEERRVEAAQKMVEAYKRLAEAYAEEGYAGDPVDIMTGKYHCEYTDVSFPCFAETFSIKRIYTGNEDSSRYFGSGWFSSLDERLVFGRQEAFQEEKAVIGEIKDIAGQAVESMYEYENAHPKHSKFMEDIEVWEDLEEACEGYLDEYSKIQSQNEAVDEKNRFVTYGKIQKTGRYYSWYDYIYYIDESGNINSCKQEEDGSWTCIDEYKAKLFSIKKCSDAEKAYVVEFSNGCKKYFTEYGLPVFYSDKNGNETQFIYRGDKISDIKLPNGVTLKLSYSEKGLLTGILQNKAAVADWTYNADLLMDSCRNSNGIQVYYTYDFNKDLIEIGKADGSSVKILYENVRKALETQKVVKAVVNENKQIESFAYDFNNGTAIHTCYSGKSEEFSFTKNHQLLSKKDEFNNTTTFTLSEDGIISSVKKNKLEYFFEYDEAGRPIELRDAYKVLNNTEYDKNGKVTKVTDGDGFYEEYTYDDKGNITKISWCGNTVSEIGYYKNGLIKTVSEKGLTTDYEYAVNGTLTDKKIVYSSGESLTQEWKIDWTGKIQSYKDSFGNGYTNEFSKSEYGGDKITTTFLNADYSRILEKDARGRIKKETVLINKPFSRAEKEYVYDGTGKVIKVYLNGKLYTDYDYYPSGLLQNYTVWKNDTNGIGTSFLYNEKGKKTEEKRYLIEDSIKKNEETVYKISYFENQNETIMKLYPGLNEDTNAFCYNYVFDENNRLKEILKPDGERKTRFYTSGGRLLSEQNYKNDSLLSELRFDYEDTGKVTVEKIVNNSFEYYVYNCFKQLESYTDRFKNIYEFEYDGRGKLIKEKTPFGHSQLTYDSKERLTSCIFRDNENVLQEEKSFQYDDSLNQITVKKGNIIDGIYRYDKLGRLIEKYTKNGGVKYHYDDFGYCISQSLGDNQDAFFEYDVMGNITAFTDFDASRIEMTYSPSGLLLEKTKRGRKNASFGYDSRGVPVKYTDNYGNVSKVSYDSKGFLKEYEDYESGITNYSFNSEDNSLTRITQNGAKYFQFFDKDGRLIEEKNSENLSRYYHFDMYGRIDEAKDYSGKQTKWEYSDDKFTVKTVFDDGDYIIKTCDCMGRIRRLENKDGVLEYEYDTAGLLTRAYDRAAGVLIEYLYDSFGRCVCKKSDMFRIAYSYDMRGRVCEVREENSGTFVRLEYDVVGREIKRTFSNGIERSTFYNQYGDIEAVITREQYGNVISASINLYDESGRLILTCNENGNYRLYKYDDKGRLSATEYLYSEEIIKEAEREARECGLNIKTGYPAGKKSSITNELFLALQKLISKYELNITPSEAQICWCENYSYTSTGSIESVSNPFGKIFYKYDLENRIISKTSANTENFGVNYEWSADGNLLLIKNQFTQTEFTYSSSNRPVKVSYKNFIDDTVLETVYKYDALGRRMSEEVNSADNHRYVYDGFSTSRIIDTPYYQNQMSTISYFDSAVKVVPDNNTDEAKYRTMDFFTSEEFSNSAKGGAKIENDFIEEKDLDRIKKLFAIPSESLMMEDRPCVGIGVGDFCVARVYLDGSRVSGKESEFYSGNYNNTQVCSISDESGKFVAVFENGTNGYSVSGGSGGGYSRSKGKLKTGELIYDLGMRDYIPSMKSFTSEDPARSGVNWYTYCSCDSINYFDKNGNYKFGTDSEQDAKYAAAIAEFLKFDKERYHELGEYLGIPKELDCADVSAFIDMIAALAAGIEDYSDKAEAFKDSFLNTAVDYSTAISDAKKTVQSGDFFKDGWEEYYTKVTEGYKRDYLRKHPEDEGERIRKEQAFEALRDPENISPGTVLVWTKGTERPKETWIGHTLTVLARDFDENGNVIGIAFIEGHTGGDKTELGYMSFVDGWTEGIFTLDSWYGEFLGAYEIENSAAEACCY